MNIDKDKDLSDYDRIFYWPNGAGEKGAVILFSRRYQKFICSAPNDLIQPLNIDAEREYQQVELYDNKLFCVNRQSLVMEVFYDSKKQSFFHKTNICFANKDLKLSENFCLTIWKHQESGILYRCLLGPLEDGRYMNFDLLERYFNPQSKSEQTIAKVFFIRMVMDNDENVPQDVVYAFDEGSKSIVCFDQKMKTFFEYNDFAGKDTVSLQVIYKEKLAGKRVKRMYFHYPYDYLPQKKKNQLKTLAGRITGGADLNTFVRDIYKEIFVCAEGEGLFRMSLLEEAPFPTWDIVWKLNRIDGLEPHVPVDIAVNSNTGEIYCLCEQNIVVLPNSGRQSAYVNEQNYKRKYDYYSKEEFT